MIQTAIIRASDKTLPDTSEHFLVLGDNHNWVFAEKNPWFLSVTDYSGHVIMQSLHGSPNLGVKMFGYEYGSSEDLRYGITGSLEELLELRERYLNNRNLADAVLEGIKGLDKSVKQITGPIDDFVKAYSKSEEVFIKNADRKVAQSQAAINSKRITKLEREVNDRKGLEKKIAQLQVQLRDYEKFKKELEQARELQKLLKKLR